MTKQFRLRNHVLLASLAAAYPVIGYCSTAASVEFAAGNVVAVTPSGSQRVIGKGSSLESGETIRTGENGRVQLKFTDGALMSLQPKTEFKVDNYQFEGKNDGSEKGFFSLIKGGLRTITGLVGKGNRDNYKITTQVATIGIRGTEYAVAFTGGTDGKLDLATGEGAVQVCNAGGCVIVTSGEAAVVTGANSKPARTETKPNLPPATTTTTKTTTTTSTSDYSTAEDKASNGASKIVVAGGLSSGSGYAVSVAGLQTPPSSAAQSHSAVTSSTTATFSDSSQLTAFSAAGYDYSAGTVASSFSFNGVIGWGTWTSGTYASDHTLSQFHYVAGIPTSTSDLSALGGLTGTYSLIGYTTPTSSVGYTGSDVKGSLSVAFGSGGILSSVSTSLSFTMNGTNVSITGYRGSGSGPDFTMSSGSCTASSCSVTSIKGFIAGANASNAGLTYQINDSSLGTVSGAAAFSKTSTKTTPPS